MTKTLIILLVVLLCLMAVGGYFLLDNMFPEAPPFECPDNGEILSISVKQPNGTEIDTNFAAFDGILQLLRSAEPTRQWSIQDYPSASSYYTIEIHTAARQYRYYVYTEGISMYIEHPYNGIYKTNQQIMDLIGSYFSE